MHTHITIVKKKRFQYTTVIYQYMEEMEWFLDSPRLFDSPVVRVSALEEMFFHDTSSNFSSVYLLCRILLAQHFAIELKCISNMPVWRTCVNINVLWTKKKLQWKGHNVLRMKALHIPVLMPLSWNSALRFRELMAVHDRRNYDF